MGIAKDFKVVAVYLIERFTDLLALVTAIWFYIALFMMFWEKKEAVSLWLPGFVLILFFLFAGLNISWNKHFYNRNKLKEMFQTEKKS